MDVGSFHNFLTIYPPLTRNTSSTQFPMMRSLKWAIWALAIPLSMAERLAHRVKWEDLMVATSEFPKFWGGFNPINRTGPPRVTHMVTNGNLEPIQCHTEIGPERTESSCSLKVDDIWLKAIWGLQNGSANISALNGLNFTAADVSNDIIKDDRVGNNDTYKRAVFQQNLDGIDIEGAYVEMSVVSR